MLLDILLDLLNIISSSTMLNLKRYNLVFVNPVSDTVLEEGIIVVTIFNPSYSRILMLEGLLSLAESNQIIKCCLFLTSK